MSRKAATSSSIAIIHNKKHCHPLRVSCHAAQRSSLTAHPQAAQRVLEALGSSIPKPTFIPLLAGWEEFNKRGKALPEETIQ